MTKHDKIQAAIWTPTMVTVAVTAMYWCGTDAPSWGGLLLCAGVAGVCGAMDFIYESMKPITSSGRKRGQKNRALKGPITK